MAQTKNNRHRSIPEMSVLCMQTLYRWSQMLICLVRNPPTLPKFKPPPCSNMGRCSQSSTTIWATEWVNFPSVFCKDSPGSRRPLLNLPSTLLSSVSGLGVELLADIVDDLGHKFVEVVKLIHKEGVLLVRVRGNVLQLILGCPGNADRVGDHTWGNERGNRKLHTCVCHSKHTMYDASLTHRAKQLYLSFEKNLFFYPNLKKPGYYHVKLVYRCKNIFTIWPKLPLFFQRLTLAMDS